MTTDPSAPSAAEAAADREALRTVLGRPLPHDWPAGAWAAGRRVTVVGDDAFDGPWQREFRGTIDGFAAPQPIEHRRARPGDLAYWVAFDEPEYDVDGDGPYRKALIWEHHLRPDPGPAEG